MPNPFVSVIIITWNRRKNIKIVLDGLKKQTYKNKEIIVVDNCSSDGTSEMIKKHYKNVKLIINKKNTGIPYAKNQAARIGRGKYLLFLDNDLILNNRGVISNMVGILEKNKKIGCVGGEINIIDGKQKIIKKELSINGEAFSIILNPKDVKMLECDFLITSIIMIPKKIFFNFNGFNEEFFYTGEDRDFGYKLKKAGYKNIIDNRTAVIHTMEKKQRIGNFYIFHKNRIKFVVLNFPFYKILLLPALDIINLFNPKKISYFKKSIPSSFSLHGSMIKKIYGIFYYFFGLTAAYIINIFLLPKLIYLRIKK